MASYLYLGSNFTLSKSHLKWLVIRTSCVNCKLPKKKSITAQKVMAWMSSCFHQKLQLQQPLLLSLPNAQARRPAHIFVFLSKLEPECHGPNFRSRWGWSFNSSWKSWKLFDPPTKKGIWSIHLRKKQVEDPPRSHAWILISSTCHYLCTLCQTRHPWECQCLVCVSEVQRPSRK